MHVRKAQHTDGVISASRVAPTPQRGVAGFNRNQWQLSIGMGGNLQLESVAGFDRNQWQSSTGIRKPSVRCALCGAFSCLRMLSPGHRDMGFNLYREALIVSIRAEGRQDVVA